MNYLRAESGQMIPEVVMVLPAFTLALVLLINVGMFVAEAARFDRVTNEVARALVTSPVDPVQKATSLLNDGLHYAGGTKGPFRASVQVTNESEPFFERRVLRFQLSFQLFAAHAAPSRIGTFTRTKTLIIPWSTGL
jgi:hypothetical protein